MKTVNVHEAKTHLSKLLAEVEAGEEVVIARAGKPVARMTSITGGPPRRRIGFLTGRFTIPPEVDADFDRWMSDEITAMFEGDS